MPEKYNEILDTILRLFPIVFLAVGAKIAIEIKHKKFTIIGSFISMFIGLAVTYLVSPYMLETFSEKWYVISIGAIAIMSDKLMEFVVFKLDVGMYLQVLFDLLFDWIKKMLK